MKKIIFFILLFCFISTVNAAVDCNKLIDVSIKCTPTGGTLTTLKPGDVVTCEVSVKSIESLECTPTFETVKEISFTLNVPSDLTLSNEINGAGFSKTILENLYIFSRETGIQESSIYKFNLTMPSVTEDKNYSLSISDITIDNNEDISIGNNILWSPVSLKVLNPKSSVNTLSKLNVSTFNLTPKFSSDILTYSLTVDTDVSKVNISVEATDPTSVITGDIGEKQLIYGNNIIKVYVKSEMDVTKTYSVSINRNDRRSDENGLSTLTVSNTYIDFKPDTIRYDVEVDKEVTSVKINSSLIDPKSSYVEGFGNGTKNLVIGTNTFYIKVKAENESIKTYTIVVVKNDGKSSVNSLSSLKVLNQSKIDFVPEKLTYSLSVSSTVKEVEIDSNLMSTKSTYVEGFGNRKIELKIGLNKIEVKVKSEKGVIKVYTINITRDDPKNNTNLKELTIENVKLDFNNDDTEYEFEVSFATHKLSIKASAEEEKTVVNIVGNESLVVGKNTVKIELTSESGKKKEFNLIVMKREKASNVSKLKNIIIKNHLINFDSDKLEYEIKITDEKEKELDITVEKIDPLSIHSIVGNSNIKSGSKIVINSYAEDGTLTAYTIKVTKEIDFLMPLIGLTGLIFIISLTVANKKKNVSIIKKDGIKEPIKKKNLPIEKKEEVKVAESIIKPVINKKDMIPGIPELDHSSIVEDEEEFFEDIKEDPIETINGSEIGIENNKGIPEIEAINEIKEETKKEDEILEI